MIQGDIRSSLLYKRQGLMGLQEDEEPAKPLKRPEKKVKLSEVAD